MKKLIILFCDNYPYLIAIGLMIATMYQNKKAFACVFMLFVFIIYLSKRVTELEYQIEIIKIDIHNK